MTLCIENLSVSFSIHGKKLQAVDGISFSVQAGQTVGLVGESGSGKSVAAQAITRLMPSASISGKIVFNGVDLINLAEKELRQVRGRQIGHIFQDPLSALNPTMRIGDQIAEGLIYHRLLDPKKAYARSVELLQLVQIAEPQLRARQYPHELSGGMRQRVLIAMAVACSPQLLIADEPTTALDCATTSQILKLLKVLQSQFQSSLLLITHDLGILKICDQVLVMYQGKIVESGPVEQVLNFPSHPYTQSLMYWRQW